MKFHYNDTAAITGGFYEGNTCRINSDVLFGLAYIATIDPDNVFKSKLITVPFWNLKRITT